MTKKATSVTIDSEILQKGRALAEQEKRSLSNLVERLLEKELNNDDLM